MTREKTARLIPNAIQVCTSTEKVDCVRTENSDLRVYFTSDEHIIDYLFTSSPSALLHFLLSKREKFPGCFPHVAKHTAGEGKAH